MCADAGGVTACRESARVPRLRPTKVPTCRLVRCVRANSSLGNTSRNCGVSCTRHDDAHNRDRAGRRHLSTGTRRPIQKYQCTYTLRACGWLVLVRVAVPCRTLWTKSACLYSCRARYYCPCVFFQSNSFSMHVLLCAPSVILILRLRHSYRSCGSVSFRNLSSPTCFKRYLSLFQANSFLMHVIWCTPLVILIPRLRHSSRSCVSVSFPNLSSPT